MEDTGAAFGAMEDSTRGVEMGCGVPALEEPLGHYRRAQRRRRQRRRRREWDGIKVVQTERAEQRCDWSADPRSSQEVEGDLAQEYGAEFTAEGSQSGQWELVTDPR